VQEGESLPVPGDDLGHFLQLASEESALSIC
jgi:hypothetical protein